MAGGANPQNTMQAGGGAPQGGPGFAGTMPHRPELMTGGPSNAPSGQPGVYDQSAGAYSAALGGTAGAMAGPNIDQFMNPYTEQVTQQTMGDLERQRQMAMNDTGAAATQANAFGGSRHGVAEALTNEGFARQGAQTFANLNQQGFDTALGAAQNQQQIGMQGANQLGNLANLGFGFGQQIGQNQMQQGTQQQSLVQSLIDASRGQYGGFTGAPGQSLNYAQQALQGANMGQSTQTTAQQPGLFNYLSMGLGLL